MKTLDDFKKDMLAQKYNGLKWEDLKFFLVKNDSRLSISQFIDEFEKMANDYAAYMCKKQREICAEKVKATWFNGHGWIIDKDSILNAPLATDKNK